MNVLRCPLPVLVFALTVRLLSSAVAFAEESKAPRKQGTWNGYVRQEFEVNGREVSVIVPRTPAAGRPWVWHGEFFGHRPEPDLALLGRGFFILYTRIPDQFGSPTAVAHWNAVYEFVTQKLELSSKPALVGLSRGGLYCYNWAAANPTKVACIYADAPVCDIRSWPLGKGKGDGNRNEIPRLLAAYGVPNESELLAKVVNPVDNLAPLAKANVPLLHVYGDADKGVPWEENTRIVAERYKALGGSITLIAKPGVGHVHGLADCTPIVEFLAEHGLTAARLDAKSQAPIPLGQRRELFVDRAVFQQLTNVKLQLHEPRDEGIVFTFDRPWEGPFSGYSTVLRDGDGFLLYYRGIDKPGLDGNPNERTLLATSRDGLHWERPNLGQYTFAGSKENNIVLADAAPVSHNFCPMIDTRPGVPANERFKAVGGIVDKLWAYVSADGVVWRKLGLALTKDHVPFRHVHLFDSQNLVFWSESEKTYVCYFRVWDGVRRIARSTSPDFATWSPAVLMTQQHDDGVAGPRPAPVEHLYTNQTAPYFRAPHLYIATAARFFEGRRVLTDEQARAIRVDPGYFQDTSDAVLLTSRGGAVYDRTFLEGFLRPGIGPRNWVSRTNYPALNVVQTGPSEMSFYVNQDYAQPTAHLRRYRLRLDGFASARADALGGEILTKVITFTGRHLTVNFATSAAGGIRCELQTPSGEPYPGFALADCVEQIGNEISRIVRWKAGADVGALRGRPVRLRLVLKDADLYAFQFTDQLTDPFTNAKE